MILSEKQIEMYNNCTFLNEGLYRNIEEKITEKNILMQFENLNSEFEKKFNEMKNKMENDGYELVNFDRIKDDYNKRKLRDALMQVREDYLVKTPSRKKYKNFDCISTVYNQSGIMNPQKDQCRLLGVKFCFIKDENGQEKLKLKDPNGVLSYSKKFFSK